MSDHELETLRHELSVMRERLNALQVRMNKVISDLGGPLEDEENPDDVPFLYEENPDEDDVPF